MSDTGGPNRIIWRDEFSTGIPSVDHEHMELIQLINDVLAAIDEGRDPEFVRDGLGEVYAQISAHFALEETIMRREEYSEFKPHKADHEKLLDEIRDLMDSFEPDQPPEEREAFVGRLEEWFVEHFRTKDARLHKELGGALNAEKAPSR